MTDTEKAKAEKLKAATMDALAERYVLLRNHKKEIEAAVKLKIDPIDEAMEAISTAMLAKLHEEGSTSSKTPNGTVYISTTGGGNIVDYEALWEFVKANDMPQVFQRRLSISEVEDHNEAHPENPVPGVTIQKIQSVRVRANNSK